MARRAEHDRRLVRGARLSAGGAVRGRAPVRDRRAAALLDRHLAPRRPEHDPRPTSRAARSEVPRTRMRKQVAAAVALFALSLIFIWRGSPDGDVAEFSRYGNAVLDGQLPY